MFEWLYRFDNSGNRIALWSAFRGSIAIGVPLFAVPAFASGSATRMAVIGALATGIVDAGGPYGQRLRYMLVNVALSPPALILGAVCGEIWWLAGVAIALIAAFGGLMRTLGPAAAPLGVTHAIAFLIGTQVPALGHAGPDMAAAYALGGLWTVFLSLLIWRARPYRRLELEIAAVWEALASLLHDINAAGAMAGTPAHFERNLSAQQRALRESTERARVLLDEARGELSDQSATIDALLVLLRAASRITTVAAALADVVLREPARTQPASLVEAARMIEHASRATASWLRHGRGEIPLSQCRAAVRQLYVGDVPADDAIPRPRRQTVPLGLALRHIENAQDAAQALFGPDRSFGRGFPRLVRARSWRTTLGIFQAHLSFRSLFLRHALRVALATGIGTAFMLWLQIPHGIWLPLTALVVSQPEFGGTLRRAIERILGTIGGAVVAAILLWQLKDNLLLDVAIVALGFGAFLLLRRRYALAMVCITPMVILLLGLSEPDPWIDIRDRLIDTALGGALALLFAYVLWPQWEHERLSARVSDALKANAEYLRAVFAMLVEGVTMDSFVVARRLAEIETGNAEAALQRMMTEPHRRRARRRRWHVLSTHLRRLNRHVGSLTAQLEERPIRCHEAGALGSALAGGLTAAAEIIEGREAAAYEAPEALVDSVRRAILSPEAGSGEDSVSILIGRITSDVGALFAASLPSSDRAS